MAINSYDDLLSALSAGRGQTRFFQKTVTVNAAGQGVSTWAQATSPQAGSYGTALVSRACNSSVTGALAFNNAPDGYDLYLVSAAACPTAASIGTLWIYDRVADINSVAVDHTVAQSITTSAWPRYTTGEGLQLLVEVTTTLTGTPTFEITYTNQDGTASRTSASVAGAANAQHRLAYANYPFVPLQAGDSGVRAISSIRMTSAATSGNLAIVVAKPLLMIPLLSAGAVVERDMVTQIPKLPLLPDDHCLAFFTMGAGATNGSVFGELTAVAG